MKKLTTKHHEKLWNILSEIRYILKTQETAEEKIEEISMEIDSFENLDNKYYRTLAKELKKEKEKENE